MAIKIIDCTIRDGGFINNWEFGDNCVKASYFAALRSGVDYFEIGYKVPDTTKGRGKYGYCKEDFISSLLKYSDQCKLVYMVDANKYDNSIVVPKCQTDNTPFNGVRIATYPDDVERALCLVENYFQKDYEVFLNLMTYSEWQKEQFDVLKRWENKDCLEAVYFVDSFGSFVPADISAHIQKLREIGFEKIGFHGHNSLQMAFANSIKAIEEGVSHIDATIYGMGRGAGNLPIEILISYLQKLDERKYNPVPYLDVIERFYLKLIEDYNWGYTLKSLLGGIRNIHPYYVSELFKNKNYTVEEIWNALDYIKEKCPISYSKEKLDASMNERFYVPSNEYASKIVNDMVEKVRIFPSEDVFSLNDLKIKDIHKDRNFLIIANGPSIVKYEDKIKKIITENGLVTIGCNYLRNIYDPMYHIFVSRKRFLKYASSISKKSTLIVPTFFGRKLLTENYDGKLEYIEIKSVDNSTSIPIVGIEQHIINLNVAVAAILTAYQMGAKEIMAVGIDGYETVEEKKVVYFYNEDDVPEDRLTASFRYEKLVEEMKRINDYLQAKGVSFSIITPTSHKRYSRNIIT